MYLLLFNVLLLTQLDAYGDAYQVLHPSPHRHVMLLRAVVREDMSMQMADMLVRDIEDAVTWLDSHVVLSSQQVTALTKQFKMTRMPSAIYRMKQSGVC